MNWNVKEITQFHVCHAGQFALFQNFPLAVSSFLQWKKSILKRQQFDTVEKVHSAAMTAFSKTWDLSFTRLTCRSWYRVFWQVGTSVFTNMLPPLQMETQVPAWCSYLPHSAITQNTIVHAFLHAVFYHKGKHAVQYNKQKRTYFQNYAFRTTCI